MTLPEKQQQLLDELSPFDDPRDRFQYIIDRAKDAPGLPKELQIDELRVEGCVSQLWLIPTFDTATGKCHFKCDSDAIITKGIATLVCEFYDGATPAEVLEHGTDFLSDVGLAQHLTGNRRNGLSNLLAKIRGFAELHTQ